MKTEILSLLVAALCHDVDHPGHSNAFEVNANTHLAMVHNNLSVLENHHAYMTFVILSDPKVVS